VELLEPGQRFGQNRGLLDCIRMRSVHEEYAEFSST
jgi:hypothetical protein